MDGIRKKLHSLPFISTILVSTLLMCSVNTPDSLELFLRLPHDMLVPIFCCNLADHLRNRVLCCQKEGGYQNDNQDNDDPYREEKIIVHNAVRCIQAYSANQLEKFFVQRTKTCIANSCFLGSPWLDVGKKGMPGRLLFDAFQKAVKEEVLLAAFVCQSAINPGCSEWQIPVKGGGNYGIRTHSKKISVGRLELLSSNPLHRTVELYVNNRTLHTCKKFNVSFLGSNYALNKSVQSLIFHPNLINSVTVQFFKTIHDFLAHNVNVMNNIALVTLCGSIDEPNLEQKEQLEIVARINDFLKQYPHIKVSIQDERLDNLIRLNKVVNETMLVHHIRGKLSKYKFWLGEFFSAQDSRFFLYDWIGICQNQDVSNNRKKLCLYLKMKQHNGCERMLTKFLNELLINWRGDMSVLSVLSHIHTPTYLKQIANTLEKNCSKYKKKLEKFFLDHPSLDQKLSVYIAASKRGGSGNLLTIT